MHGCGCDLSKRGPCISAPPGVWYVMASLQVSYRKSTPINEPVTLRARITGMTEKRTVLTCSLSSQEDERATGELIAVPVPLEWRCHSCPSRCATSGICGFACNAVEDGYDSRGTNIMTQPRFKVGDHVYVAMDELVVEGLQGEKGEIVEVRLGRGPDAQYPGPDEGLDWSRPTLYTVDFGAPIGKIPIAEEVLMPASNWDTTPPAMDG